MIAPRTTTTPPDLGGDGAPSYHGRPVLKEPAWTWEVPCYLFAGGLAGGSSVVALAGRLAGFDELARRSGLVAAGAAAVCPPLLISDLGRPRRFVNMLRVFKPTSVMSVGSWVLAGYSGAAIATAGLGTLGRFPRLRATAEAAAGGLGTVMLTYTGALVADTSVPVWHEARRELPALFAAGGLASAAAAGVLVLPAADAGPLRRLAVGASLAEVAIERVMRVRLGGLGEVYEEQQAGRFHRATQIATAIGTSLLLLGGRRRPWLSRTGASALLAGAAAQRWAVFRAGFQSARDPQATLGPQRARLDRGEGHTAT